MRRGFTLIEMLVAMAITLIMMGAVVTLFGTVGNSISGSRATMEISERLRNARNILQRDLGGMTVTVQPSRRPESDEGYLEYIEGLAADYWPGTFFSTPLWWPNGSGSVPTASDVPFAAPTAVKALVGDTDDILAFTVRSQGEPFLGLVMIGGVPTTIQSQIAEIVYFLAVAPGSQTIIDPVTGTQFQPRTLYRRILIVSPSIVPGPHGGQSVAQYQAVNDLAVRIQGADFIACTLGDLTKRENRFAHNPAAFPFPMVGPPALIGARIGADVILTNVLAFDVKAYDSSVPVMMTTAGVATLPSDPGYPLTSNTTIGSGGYVDLGYNRYVPTAFASSQPLAGFGSLSAALPRVYDTWSLHYENDNIDNNADTRIDTGLNGLDDNGNGIVDEPNESDAPAPYNVPLRGIQIKIRVYEPDSRQVREVTVVQDFMPQ
jgi:prepilin-type N-terminal cleavage/methylation domain-containing protein